LARQRLAQQRQQRLAQQGQQGLAQQGQQGLAQLGLAQQRLLARRRAAGRPP
jgi:hypothetical protein